MGIASRVGAIISKHGEAVTLRLRGDVGDSPEFIAQVSVKAKRHNADGDSLSGDMQQVRVGFHMSNRELSSNSPPLRAPRKLDEIEDSDGNIYIVQVCDTRKHGAAVVSHMLSTTGDA